MKFIKLITLVFFIGICFANAQTQMFDQEYYYIAKDEIKQLTQIQDSMYIFECNDLKKCKDTPNFSYKILKDSMIDTNTKMYFLKGKKYNRKDREVQEKKVIITKIKNDRIKLQEVHEYSNKKRLQTSILYATSELTTLKPISKISQAEADEIYEKLVAHMKSLQAKQVKIEEYMNWEKINDLVISKGYSPIGAGEELSQKSDKF